ncbi:DNA alkylation repair protein [Microbacterium paludicola]
MGAMNELINTSVIDDLAERIAAVDLNADVAVLSGIPDERLRPLSLRERTDLVAASLDEAIPQGFSRLASVVRAMLADPAFGGWIVWPVGESVTTRALAEGTPHAFDGAMALMAELTGRLTAEFPIRRLLAHDLARALPIVQSWTTSQDEHVRRLASEGTRAYLPWAIRVRSLIEAPDATLPILDALYRDPSDYVRRSVGNHLNDLSRHAPDVVVATAARWLAAPDATTPAVVKRGLRTLVKKGNPGALALLGYAASTFTVGAISLRETTVPFPGAVGLSIAVTNDGPEAADAAVDYVIHYMRANGSTAPKVFKLGTRRLASGETAVFTKRHALRPMTTRVHHPGEHAVQAQVNGERHGWAAFEVVFEA